MNINKNRGTAAGLNEAGSAWINQSANLPLAGLGDIDHLLRSIGRTFGLTSRETLATTCAALSIMVGPCVTIRTPFGSIIPCSLQLLLASDGHGNMFGAAECLGDGVVEMFAKLLGRRRVGSPLKENDPATKLLNLRKQQIFPVGELLTVDSAQKLVEEDGDCAFGSLSYELALAEFRRTPPKVAPMLHNIMRAGWRGSMVAAVEGHPVYPTISLVWGADSCQILEAVQEGLLEQLPGLLIGKSRFSGTEQPVVAASWPDTMRRQWYELLMHSFKRRMGTASRHADPQSPLELTFEVQAGDEVAALSSFSARYTQGHGVAARVLLQAPLQVAKLAGLLTIAQSLDEINLLTVQFAKEIYRGLCHDTLAAVDDALNASPDSDASKRRRVLEKLRLLGALPLKDLASTYPKLPFEDLPRVVLSMVDEGVIENVDGILRLPSIETKEGADEARLVMS